MILLEYVEGILICNVRGEYVHMDLTNDELLYNIQVSGFAYELLRHDFLCELLGNDYEEILYLGGKRLARKYVMNSVGEIITFFEAAGFGNLSMTKESNSKATFSLTSLLILERMKSDQPSSYHLEAGFLAQSFENLKLNISESTIKIHKKTGTIDFHVEWDPSDSVE